MTEVTTLIAGASTQSAVGLMENRKAHQYNTNSNKAKHPKLKFNKPTVMVYGESHMKRTSMYNLNDQLLSLDIEIAEYHAKGGCLYHGPRPSIIESLKIKKKIIQ